MKIYAFLLKSLYILNISANSIFAQDEVVIDHTKFIARYLYTYMEDSSSSDKIKTDEMCLYLGSKYSKFEHAGRYFRDSVIRVHQDAEDQEATFQKIWSIVQQRSTGRHFSKYKIIKNLNNDSIVMFEGPVNKNDYLKITETINPEWNLVYNADTLISSYKCHKATTYFAGRNYTAWYTTEIPINDGPYKFKGLPGLIVKIEDTQKHHVFELTAFNELNYKKHIYFDKDRYREVNMESYYNAKRISRIKLAKLIGNTEQAQPYGNTNTGEAEARLLSVNNYIERY